MYGRVKTDKNDSTISRLLIPSPALSGCIFLAIHRDTRTINLSYQQRFNHFFTSPFCSITWYFTGSAHLIANPGDFASPQDAREIDQITFSGPSTKPTISWNPAQVRALTIGFFPNAWQTLSGIRVKDYIDQTLPLQNVVHGPLLKAAQSILNPTRQGEEFDQFEKLIARLWAQNRPRSTFIPHNFSDWASALITNVSMSQTGKSLRQLQRRLKNLAGLSRRDINAHMRAEELFVKFATSTKNTTPPLSRLALEAGYADQSHMGRDVRRITGNSPAQITKLIATQERYWCYRLLEQYYS